MHRNSIVLVLLAIALLVALLFHIYSLQPHGKMLNNTAYDNVAVSPEILGKLHSIAANYVLMKIIGNGTAMQGGFMNGSKVPLLVNGKPEVLFVSADYCPFCAVTRWSLIIALMRFGNFISLHYMTSSSTDLYPNTPTFTFYNSSYESPLITFIGIELANNVLNPVTNSYTPLDRLNASQNAIMKIYDPQEGTPFTDFGNRFILLGALGDPSAIQFLNWSVIIQKLQDPNSTIAKEIIGGANVFTKKICEMIDNKSQVCQAFS